MSIQSVNMSLNDDEQRKLQEENQQLKGLVDQLQKQVGEQKVVLMEITNKFNVQEKQFNEQKVQNENLQKAIEKLTSQLDVHLNKTTRGRPHTQKTEKATKTKRNANQQPKIDVTFKRFKPNSPAESIQRPQKTGDDGSENSEMIIDEQNENDTEIVTTDDTIQTNGDNVLQQPANNSDGDDEIIDDGSEVDINWATVTYKRKNVKGKAKPIQVTIADGGYMALNAILGRHIGGANYIANHMRAGNTVRIYPKSDDVSERIIQLLEQHKYKFHWFKNKNDRKKCFVLKGLSGFDEIEPIYGALVTAGFPEDTTVDIFSTGFQRANPGMVHNQMFKVIVNAQFDEKIIDDIDGLFNTKVPFEKMKKKSCGTVQKMSTIFSHSGKLPSSVSLCEV